MSIDTTSDLLTSLEPDLPLDLVDRIEARRASAGSRFDKAMDRALQSRAIWLGPVLMVQAALALRPTSALASNEATSIDTGHALIAHALHGTVIPDFGSYFSGIPALYTVPAALISDIGGPTSVRLASTVLTLLATVFVYLATRRLFGQGAALVAGAVFALSAGTLFAARFLSADALCLAALAAGFWLAVSCGERPRRAIALGPCLVLAAAASYLAIPFALTVAVVAAVHAVGRSGARQAVRRLGPALGSMVIAVAVTLILASPSDLAGLRVNLLDHASMSAEASGTLHHQLWTAIGPLAVLAAVGIALTARNRLIGAVLVVIGVAIVGAQAGLGTVNPAHDSCGLAVVFLAPVVGVTGMAMLGRGRLLGLRAPLALAGMVMLIATGIASAATMLNDWPNAYYGPAALAHAEPVAQSPAPVTSSR